MNQTLRKQNGFALLITVLGLAVISILGLAIMGVTASNLKMTKIDSRKQSTYYIAEAGINYVIDNINTEISKHNSEYETDDKFFQNLENLFTIAPITLNNFEKNYGEQPEAKISVKKIRTDENSRDYEIKSIGKIGGSSKTVRSVISIKWSKQEDNQIKDNLMLYTQAFSFQGSAINAVSGSVIIGGLQTHNLNGGSLLNISNMYFNGPVKMDGGSASFGSKDMPGNIYINGNLDFWNGTRNVYGDIRVNGNFKLKDAIIHGSVYVNGDLELGWTPQIYNKIYYTGKLIAPNNFSIDLLSKCIKVDKVDSFDIPSVDFELKDDSWYTNHGYIIKKNENGNIPANAKMLVDNYENKNWQPISGQIVIVSKGDIILRGGDGFTGALIAPNGKVEYSGDGTFNGVIISKNKISLPAGGNYFNFKSLSEIFKNDIPVTIKNHVGDENTENDSTRTNGISLTIKTSIREK